MRCWIEQTAAHAVKRTEVWTTECSRRQRRPPPPRSSGPPALGAGPRQALMTDSNVMNYQVLAPNGDEMHLTYHAGVGVGDCQWMTVGCNTMFRHMLAPGDGWAGAGGGGGGSGFKVMPTSPWGGG